MRARGRADQHRKNPHRAWQPLLDGALRDQALVAVREIAVALREPTLPTIEDGLNAEWAAARPLALLTGRAGIALFFGYLAKAGLLADGEQLARQCLEEAEAGIAAIRMDASLCEGFTGIAWAHAHLRRRLFGERDRGELREIDELLVSLLRTWASPAPFELLYGLVGIGVYALERLPRRSAGVMARLVIQRLAERAEAPDGLAAWPTPPGPLALFPEGDFNLGLAHGAPGVVGFLGRAAAAGIALRTTVPLLRRATKWVLARRLPSGSGAAYPAYYRRNGTPGPPARTAWCYGDPGVAMGLLAAARGDGNRAWQAEAMRIAEGAARRPVPETMVLDAGLCHGSAGMGQIFNRLWQTTGSEEFRHSAVGWFQKTLAYRRPGQGIAGFVALDGPTREEVREVPRAGVLIGAAGVGLALLAAATPVEPAWDRVLLLDFPMQRAPRRSAGRSPAYI